MDKSPVDAKLKPYIKTINRVPHRQSIAYLIAHTPSLSGNRPGGSLDAWIESLYKCNRLDVKQLENLQIRVRQILMEEPNVVKISTPVTVVGDIHGQIYDLIDIFHCSGPVPDTNYLFMGDYVDRGFHSVETITLLLCLKLRYPKRITLLRGNHESRSISATYGFYDECLTKYDADGVWGNFMDTFDLLPICAQIEDVVFCMHGGLSPDIKYIDDIAHIDRKQEIPPDGAMCDILWSDPSDLSGFQPSTRGAGYRYGADISKRFRQDNKLEFILRGHQLVMRGNVWSHKDSVATIFSAPNYCYRCGNLGSICELSDARTFAFLTFPSAPRSTLLPPTSQGN